MGNQEKFDDIHRETVTQAGPSRSFMATDGNNVDTPLGIGWNTDGNAWTLVVTKAYELGVPWAVSVVTKIANDGVYQGTYASQSPFLREFGQAYCQALVKSTKKV